MLKHILIMLLVLWFCLFATELMAPETTERDIFGFESYRTEDNGAIFDSQGGVRGWITENFAYDEYWNIHYHIRGNRHYRAEEYLI